MKKLLAAALIAPILSSFAGDFQLVIKPQMQLKYQSQLLIERDSLSCNDQELKVFQKQDEFTDDDGRTVYNQFGETSGIRFRREISVAPDGSSTELSMQFAVDSQPAGTPLRRVAYRVYIPLKRLIGSEWTARVGRARNVTVKKGQLTAQTQGEFVGEKIRQIAFKCTDGSQIVIDCNPRGVNIQGDFAGSNTGRWNAIIMGNYLVLNNHVPAEFFGKICGGHIVIYEGGDQDYFTRHAHNRYFYYSDLKPDSLLALGAVKTGKQYEKVHTRIWTHQNKAGWLDNKDLQVRSIAPAGALYSYTNGSKPAVFRLSSLRKGLHLLTLNIASDNKPAGPFDIACNGKYIIRNGKVSANSIGQYLIPIWLETGSANLKFSGNWQISSIGDQLLQSSYEDFTFRRGFWRRKEIFEPSVINTHRAFTAEPDYRIAYTEYPLPSDIQSPQHAITFQPIKFTRPDFSGKKDWRGGNIIGSLGPGNSGTFTEFDTPEKITRRLAELKKSNIRVIIINGMLSRHASQWHKPRVANIIKQITAQGHEHDMKFIDHQDFSLLWDGESGFRTLVENSDALQHSIGSGLPARGICLNNERYVNDFIRHLSEYVRYTNIDGIMLDETTFHDINYCACADCRKLFTALTGLYLPVDELDKNLYEMNSPLWRSWLNFRRHSRERFWNRIKTALQKVRKDFVIMGYNTHGNLTGSKHRYAMGDPNNYVDFYGTEVMPRNVFANTVATASFRKAMTMYPNSQNVPVYTMTYATGNNFDLQYFGWALSNLHGQTYWDYIARSNGKFDFCAFDTSQGNMDLQKARSVCKIALLYSYPSLLWGKYSSSTSEIIGWSQLLSRKHYQHDFISADSLEWDRLRKYNVIIAGNAMVLTALQLQQLLKFAENGGTVYFCNRASVWNAGGEEHKEWPLGKLFGLKMFVKNSMRPVGIVRGQEKLFKYEKFIPAVRVEPLPVNGKVERLWDFEVAPKYGRRGALYCLKYGKGKLYYSPMLFGTAIMQNEISVGSINKYQRTPLMEAAALKIISDLINDHRVWQPQQVPETVLSSVFKSGNDLYVHLLNHSGSAVPFQSKIPILPGNEAWSDPGKIQFTLPYKNIRKVTAYSPEFIGNSKDLPFKNVEQGTQITVPAQTFKIYTVIKINL